MNECYYYLLFLSLFSSLIKTLSINLPNVTIQHVCEHELLFIKCSNVNETIQIIRSMYGRTSQRICNHDLLNQVFYKTCANIEQSKNQTKFRCNGKSTCQILIDNSIYTDPCGLTIPKHFEVHYRCINLEKICSELFSNCSKSQDLNCIKKIQESFSCYCPSTICKYNQENQLIGFIENTCMEEKFQGIHWSKTLVNKGQHMSCPHPCTGQIFRFCQMNNQWTKPNYTNCQCPIETSNQLSMHHTAHNYVFQCNFWLIKRLLPKDNQCIFETDDNSDSCLLSAFENMSFTSCLTFSIDFKNIGFEIFIPIDNKKKFHLLITKFYRNEIIVDKSESTSKNLPMMFIDKKTSNSTLKSLILIEQSNHLNSIQTANVTVIFNHQSSEIRYQCRAYRSINSSFQFDSSDIFFLCQLLCSNGSHVICQCPFYNPLMHYVLHLDTSISKDDFNLLMIDNDLKDQCSIEHVNQSIEQSIKKIDDYLNKFSEYNNQKKNLAKKLISFIDTLIDNENLWFNESFHRKWNNMIQLIEQIEFIGLQLIDLPNSFSLIRNHIELFVNFQKFNQSIEILLNQNLNLTYFILTKFDKYLNLKQSSNQLNSHIINLNLSKKKINENIQIIFQHLNILNTSNELSTCVYLKKDWTIQWSTEGCYLVLSNSTHSICSCNHLSTFAVLKNFKKVSMKIHMNQLSFITKIGCIISIICLIITIIVLILRHRTDMNDDLLIVRNILHINMSICLLIAQFLFFFGFDQIKYEFGCRILIILLHYFLLATFSWIFVDEIELIIALKHLFKIDRIRIFAYAFYAYGFPLLIIILSISLSNHELYSNKHCWFSYDNPFVWSFSIPFILLILVNICFFILSIYAICKHWKNSNSSEQIGFSLRDITILAILFGITWFIGLFYLQQQNSIVFSYIFTILNSFENLLIFLFYCLFKNPIQYINFHQLFHIYKKSIKEEKSNQHYNTSSSGYSSAHSSDINKLDHQSSFRTNPEYLSSMPIGLLSTFRYQTSNIPRTLEQNEELLKKYPIDLHHSHDDHQYYEIG